MKPEIQKFCSENRPIDWVEIASMNGISSDIVGAEKVNDRQREWLKSNNYLVDDENILKFYSYGVYSIEEGGALLTDLYFGGWYIEEGNLGGWWSELGSICSITRKDDSEGTTRVLYDVLASDGRGIELSLPKSGERANELIQQTLFLNEAAATEEHRTACASLEANSDTAN